MYQSIAALTSLARPLSVSSSRSRNLRQSSVMFADDKWLGGTVLWRGGGNERTGHLFLGGKSEAAHTQSCHEPVACSGWRHVVCMFTFDLCTCVRERERERERERGCMFTFDLCTCVCVREREREREREAACMVLNWITFWLLQSTLFRLCHWHCCKATAREDGCWPPGL